LLNSTLKWAEGWKKREEGVWWICELTYSHALTTDASWWFILLQATVGREDEDDDDDERLIERGN
jgi:hypothetical protein